MVAIFCKILTFQHILVPSDIHSEQLVHMHSKVGSVIDIHWYYFQPSYLQTSLHTFYILIDWQSQAKIGNYSTSDWLSLASESGAFVAWAM